ncbi:MAG TPA: branched-chain amino acid ABC transporter permease [Thermotogota bacterium]|nr:branched-chain amino acid ABC transporter permease [Thermotogota bacterium]HPJ87806.1 branched-chain amino acid ABC transporter permease [Thermotogota bacterium]HPR95196.1 branched-chain amino acid ABC transporter permease [Thermotogota bacterium]
MLQSLLINGTINSSIYALIALGFSLTFGVAGIVNLYHGAYYMVAAYLTYVLSSAGVPLWLSAVFALLLVMGLGGVMMKYPLLYLKKKGESIYLLIFTLGGAYFTQYLLKMIFGARFYSIPPFMDNSVSIGSEIVPGSRVFAFIVSVITIVVVMLFIGKTSIGKKITATSQDVYAAELVGINTNLIFVVTAAISALLAGIAGVVISPYLSISPTMWLSTLIKAFAIVIFGGLGSLGGSIIAAFIMGYLETFISLTWTSSMTEVAFLVVVFIFLIFKPSGLMGKKTL